MTRQVDGLWSIMCNERRTWRWRSIPNLDTVHKLIGIPRKQLHTCACCPHCLANIAITALRNQQGWKKLKHTSPGNAKRPQSPPNKYDQPSKSYQSYQSSMFRLHTAPFPGDGCLMVGSLFVCLFVCLLACLLFSQVASVQPAFPNLASGTNPGCYMRPSLPGMLCDAKTWNVGANLPHHVEKNMENLYMPGILWLYFLKLK